VILELDNLRVWFGATEVVRGVSLALKPGEALGVVGESGSGKSVSALAPWGLLRNARVEGGTRFLGADWGRPSTSSGRTGIGKDVGFVFQDPMGALNPALRVGEQVSESLRVHQKLGRAEARAQAIELLRRVGIPSPELRVDAWPHELSGGLRQRALIASAIACKPRLLIADEPTTALDVTVQAQVLELLSRLRKEDGLAVIFISHDLHLVAEFCDTLAVMYAGRIVESGPTAEVLAVPRHPYTRALLESAPRPGLARLKEIPGGVPDPAAPLPGCRFHPRCSSADARCREDDPATTTEGARSFRCHHPADTSTRPAASLSANGDEHGGGA
jgi:oligopeptide/dipeptide ABC transporter ATP-binding protein